MRKSLLLLILSIWSAQLFAGTANTVRVRTDVGLVVNGRTDVTFTLGSSSNSDGSAEGTPARVYIPMDGPLVGADDEINYLAVPGVGALFNSSNASYYVSLPLYINSTASNYYLYLMVKDSSNAYKIAGVELSPFNGATNVDWTFNFSTKVLCEQSLLCGDFAATGNTEKAVLSYFFLSSTLPTGMPIGTTGFTPASFPGGMYYEFNMSNRIFTASQLTTTITGIRPGDGRVEINYTSSAGMVKPKAMRLYNHGGTAAAVTANQPIKSYFTSGGSLVDTEFTYATEGQITLTGLINGTTAYYSILMTDNYNFGSTLSDDLDGSSKSIEQLLKANQCFLLTAGFGQEHFIIDYFRHFRDRVLVNSFLGREFIHFYYKLAPKYALLLYRNESLRMVVRGAAYVLYFIFNHYLLLLAGALITSYGSYLFKKREKINI